MAKMLATVKQKSKPKPADKAFNAKMKAQSARIDSTAKAIDTRKNQFKVDEYKFKQNEAEFYRQNPKKKSSKPGSIS